MDEWMNEYNVNPRELEQPNFEFDVHHGGMNYLKKILNSVLTEKVRKTYFVGRQIFEDSKIYRTQAAGFSIDVVHFNIGVNECKVYNDKYNSNGTTAYTEVIFACAKHFARYRFINPRVQLFYDKNLIRIIGGENGLEIFINVCDDSMKISDILEGGEHK